MASGTRWHPLMQTCINVVSAYRNLLARAEHVSVLSDRPILCRSQIAEELRGEHTCSTACCEFECAGNVFICRSTGRIHICGPDCETRTQTATGDVCCISGIQLTNDNFVQDGWTSAVTSMIRQGLIKNDTPTMVDIHGKVVKRRRVEHKKNRQHQLKKDRKQNGGVGGDDDEDDMDKESKAFLEESAPVIRLMRRKYTERERSVKFVRRKAGSICEDTEEPAEAEPDTEDELDYPDRLDENEDLSSRRLDQIYEKEETGSSSSSSSSSSKQNRKRKVVAAAAQADEDSDRGGGGGGGGKMRLRDKIRREEEEEEEREKEAASGNSSFQARRADTHEGHSAVDDLYIDERREEEKEEQGEDDEDAGSVSGDEKDAADAKRKREEKELETLRSLSPVSFSVQITQDILRPSVLAGCAWYTPITAVTDMVLRTLVVSVDRARFHADVANHMTAVTKSALLCNRDSNACDAATEAARSAMRLFGTCCERAPDAKSLRPDWLMMYVLFCAFTWFGMFKTMSAAGASSSSSSSSFKTSAKGKKRVYSVANPGQQTGMEWYKRTVLEIRGVKYQLSYHCIAVLFTLKSGVSTGVYTLPPDAYTQYVAPTDEFIQRTKLCSVTLARTKATLQSFIVGATRRRPLCQMIQEFVESTRVPVAQSTVP